MAEILMDLSGGELRQRLMWRGVPRATAYSLVRNRERSWARARILELLGPRN